jgi:Restriction endonuclease
LGTSIRDFLRSRAIDVTAQQRGFRLEDLLFDLLQLSEFEYTPPFRTPGNEQVDGHFRYEKFDYLVEAKWEKDLTKQPDLSIFDGKIRGKAQSTRGLFLSAMGFDEHGIRKFSGDAPRIVLMTGEDLALVLSGRFSLADAMKAKIDAIVRYGTIHFPLRNA